MFASKIVNKCSESAALSASTSRFTARSSYSVYIVRSIISGKNTPPTGRCSTVVSQTGKGSAGERGNCQESSFRTLLVRTRPV